MALVVAGRAADCPEALWPPSLPELLKELRQQGPLTNPIDVPTPTDRRLGVRERDGEHDSEREGEQPGGRDQQDSRVPHSTPSHTRVNRTGLRSWMQET